MIFIGPSLLSGIGQLTNKYRQLFPDAKYYVYNEDIPECDNAFLFALPMESVFDRIPIIKKKCKNVICMTICETETVHEDYGKLFEHFDKIAVASEFCKRVFSRQFPDTEFYVIHAYVPPEPYTFYHIGNILDPRKNFNEILKAFVTINIKYPDTKLLVKSTCKQDVKINLKNVEVINGLVSDAEINKIHGCGDCYVSASSSEGVGMGAVESALRDKPVITPSYGAPGEYIKTPYMIECGLQELERDDFLFKKGMSWGKPDKGQLLEFMRHAYETRVRTMDHEHTKNLVGKSNVLQEFIFNVIGQENDETNENGTTHK